MKECHEKEFVESIRLSNEDIKGTKALGREREMDIKIAIACSTGGHMVQARQFASVYEKYNHFYFTFNGGVAEELKKNHRVYSIPNIIKQNPLTWIVGAVKSSRIAWKEKPDVVLTTGAGIVVFFCIFSKILGAKLIFLESLARVESPTLTARILYPFSDLFLVQWPGLMKYFPRARYAGRLL